MLLPHGTRKSLAILSDPKYYLGRKAEKKMPKKSAKSGRSRSSSKSPSRKKTGKKSGKKSRSPSPSVKGKKPPDLLSPDAMVNGYYISHNVTQFLEYRGFGWANEGAGKKKKGKGKKKKKK